MVILAGEAKSTRILVVRTDRIGDVILSTPVFISIRRARPDWKITALVRPLVAPLLNGHPDIDEVMTLGTDEKPSFANTHGLAEALVEKRFDVALHLYSDFWISLAAWRAGIDTRIGPASKLARIFYTTAVPQNRSKGEGHEADYNLALLAPLGIPPVRTTSIAPVPQHIVFPDGLLDPARKNVGVYPGMGGSARNWKPEKYARLIGLLEREGMNVVLVQGVADAETVAEVESYCAEKPKKYAATRLMELAALIKKLDCFVAPSTGPLHIATAVGTPAVGIYCPIRVCLPRRWGPIGGRDIALMPDVPVCERCTTDECRHYDCMDLLTEDSVSRAVKERV